MATDLKQYRCPVGVASESASGRLVVVCLEILLYPRPASTK